MELCHLLFNWLNLESGKTDCGEFVFMRSQSYSASHSWTPVLVCISQVNWTQFLDRNVSGGLEVEPKSSVLYSTAIVFSKVRNFCLLLTLHNITQSEFMFFVSDFWWDSKMFDVSDVLSGEPFICVVAVGVWWFQRHRPAVLHLLPTAWFAELQLVSFKSVGFHFSALWNRRNLGQWIVVSPGLLSWQQP